MLTQQERERRQLRKLVDYLLVKRRQMQPIPGESEDFRRSINMPARQLSIHDQAIERHVMTSAFELIGADEPVGQGGNGHANGADESNGHGKRS